MSGEDFNTFDDVEDGFAGVSPLPSPTAVSITISSSSSSHQEETTAVSMPPLEKPPVPQQSPPPPQPETKTMPPPPSRASMLPPPRAGAAASAAAVAVEVPPPPLQRQSRANDSKREVKSNSSSTAIVAVGGTQLSALPPQLSRNTTYSPIKHLYPYPTTIGARPEVAERMLKEEHENDILGPMLDRETELELSKVDINRWLRNKYAKRGVRWFEDVMAQNIECETSQQRDARTKAEKEAAKLKAKNKKNTIMTESKDEFDLLSEFDPSEFNEADPSILSPLFANGGASAAAFVDMKNMVTVKTLEEFKQQNAALGDTKVYYNVSDRSVKELTNPFGKISFATPVMLIRAAELGFGNYLHARAKGKNKKYDKPDLVDAGTEVWWWLDHSVYKNIEGYEWIWPYVYRFKQKLIAFEDAFYSRAVQNNVIPQVAGVLENILTARKTKATASWRSRMSDLMKMREKGEITPEVFNTKKLEYDAEKRQAESAPVPLEQFIEQFVNSCGRPTVIVEQGDPVYGVGSRDWFKTEKPLFGYYDDASMAINAIVPCSSVAHGKEWAKAMALNPGRRFDPPIFEPIRRPDRPFTWMDCHLEKMELAQVHVDLIIKYSDAHNSFRLDYSHKRLIPYRMAILKTNPDADRLLTQRDEDDEYTTFHDAEPPISRYAAGAIYKIRRTNADAAKLLDNMTAEQLVKIEELGRQKELEYEPNRMAGIRTAPKRKELELVPSDKGQGGVAAAPGAAAAAGTGDYGTYHADKRSRV